MYILRLLDTPIKLALPYLSFHVPQALKKKAWQRRTHPLCLVSHLKNVTGNVTGHLTIFQSALPHSGK